MNDSEQKPTIEKGVGRRRLLKALLASGGVVALTGLPGRWSKPTVEAGELSAHAQASPVNSNLQLVGPLRIFRMSPAPNVLNNLSIYSAECQYKDPSQSITKCNTSAYGKTQCDPNVSTSVNFVSPEKAAQGSIGFQFQTALCNATTTEYCVSIKSNGRTSNTVCGDLPLM